jgi:hypothetical protein
MDRGHAVRKFAAFALLGLVCFVLFLAAREFVRGVDRWDAGPPPAARAPEFRQEVEPSHSLILLATTEDGVKVYKLQGPQAVVPVVLAVSPSGQVTLR